MTTAARVRDSADRYLEAIAWRNRAWCRWQNARDYWLSEGSPTGGFLAAVNELQAQYEYAERDLWRARVHWRGSGQGAA